MKNTITIIVAGFMKNLLIMVLICLFSISGVLSCASISNTNVRKEYPRVDSKPPFDAFGLVIIETTYKPGECLPSKNIEMCHEVIKLLPPVKKPSVGSGLLVQGKTKTVFLTAAHVCLPDEIAIYERDGMRIKLEPTNSLKVRVHTGETITGNVEKTDVKSDLCAVSLEKSFAKPVKWAEKAPNKGDKVYALSAPMGINDAEMTLFFSGYYSGKIYGMHHYTIPTRPGSSGSVVLDRNYNGVGMLNAAYITMESIGIGAGHEAIKSFLDSI